MSIRQVFAPQEAAEKLAAVLTAWEKETGYIMISEGQDTIVATIHPDTGGWRYASSVRNGDQGWEVGHA